MWINLKFLYTKQPLLQHICNLCTFLHTILCLSVITESYSSQVPNGVKSVNKDLGPLTLPPSAFSASSVYQNKPEYQPHKANFVVFASKEEISGAWCPAKLIHKELDEWLQIDFGALKLIKVLFSEGGGLNQVRHADFAK
ncbi:Discoidin domain-containing receptor 2 isoform 1 [Schistosoma japonicum]|uniref:Discoidin domain-containing receptor 2 isoform 1 n=1 Tax=Schistosoma japonicum TaxID=6182 RepID=A0A4Z2D900_SCHJA|nr:Discoidin domain-containing receptor 2 isoform 1 [Schistosoma japonicum]